MRNRAAEGAALDANRRMHLMTTITGSIAITVASTPIPAIPARSRLRRPRAFGLAARISSCSYRDGDIVYLEEDDDQPLFLEAAFAAGWDMHVDGVDYADEPLCVSCRATRKVPVAVTSSGTFHAAIMPAPFALRSRGHPALKSSSCLSAIILQFLNDIYFWTHLGIFAHAFRHQDASAYSFVPLSLFGRPGSDALDDDGSVGGGLEQAGWSCV